MNSPDLGGPLSEKTREPCYLVSPIWTATQTWPSCFEMWREVLR
jgi:hypothetical protein